MQNKCPNCGGAIDVRNPSGECDHLYYPENMIHQQLTIYTDGACHGNGFGNAKSAYGIYCVETGYSESGPGHAIVGGEIKNTNNTAELNGILKALIYAGDKTLHVKIISDSKYAIGSSFVWNLRPNKKNYELIREIIKAQEPFDKIEHEWIRGHAGNLYNEMVDTLANDYIFNTTNQ